MSQSTINERFKEIRKQLKLSQDSYGETIGIKRSGISSIELGNRSVSERHIKLLEAEFNINGDWLRTGEGDMFITDAQTKRAYLMGKYLAENDPFKQKVIDFFLSATPEEWKLLERFIDSVATDDRD